jgi:hypothetical protein
MSVSEQSRSSSPRTSRGSIARIRRRRRREQLWYGVSLGLHGVALIALIYLTPVRELVRQVAQQIKPEATMSSHVLMDLAQAIDDRAADQIKANTREMDAVFADMEDIQARMSARFQAFAEQQRNTAAADALEEMKAAISQMEKAGESIGRGAPIEETDRYQALAEQAQERAGQKLDMAPFDVQAAVEAEGHAQDVHQEAKAAHDQDRSLKEQIPSREATLKTEQARSDQRRQEVETAKQRLQELDDPKKQENQQKEVDRLAKAAEDQDTKTAAALDTLTTTQDQQRQAHQDAQTKQDAAIVAQKEALAALQSAIDQHKQQLAQALLAQPPAGAQASQTPSAEQPGPQAPPDVAALYQSARSAEDRIADTLKEVRAMDLAMVRDIKLEDARGDIDVVRPVRPDLDTELLREDVRTGARLEEHKAEVRKALRESNSMVNLAHRMLEMANQSVEKMKFGTDVPMAAYQPPDQQDFELIIRELAMEDVAGRISDMSGAMMAAEQMMQGQGQGQGGAARRMQDIKDLTQDVEGDQRLMAMGFGEGEGAFPRLPEDVPTVGARKIDSAGIPTQFMSLSSWYTIGPFPNPNRINIDREFPPDSLIDLDATYTGKDGRTIRWKFAQSDNNQMVPADPQDYGIWYAYTELYSDQPRDVWIAAGTDDRGTLKINGVPVWISSKRLKGWQIDEVWRKVHLSQGVNRILYRVENGWMHIGFSLTLKLDDQ